jgi:CheY-like chemotaxis protein
MILRALEKLGYAGDLAENGREALDMLAKTDYHLVFMDVMMPIMDGYEATKAIHERYKGKTRPVIIAMTANALSGDRERILAQGMDDYISKPFKLDEVRQKIDKWRSEILAS